MSGATLDDLRTDGCAGVWCGGAKGAMVELPSEFGLERPAMRSAKRWSSLAWKSVLVLVDTGLVFTMMGRGRDCLVTDLVDCDELDDSPPCSAANANGAT